MIFCNDCLQNPVTGIFLNSQWVLKKIATIYSLLLSRTKIWIQIGQQPHPKVCQFIDTLFFQHEYFHFIKCTCSASFQQHSTKPPDHKTIFHQIFSHEFLLYLNSSNFSLKSSKAVILYFNKLHNSGRLMFEKKKIDEKKSLR